MKILVEKNGTTKQIYNDDFIIEALQIETIRRASVVEPVELSPDRWTADMSLSTGPILGPFKRRDEAIKAEIDWLEENNLYGSMSTGSIKI